MKNHDFDIIYASFSEILSNPTFPDVPKPSLLSTSVILLIQEVF